MGQPIEGSNPSLSATALTGPTDDRHAGPTSPSWWWTPRPRGRGYPPPIDLRLRVPVQDRRGPTDDRRGPTGDLRGRGFSDLRAGFVLRDESSRRERSRAPRGSGCATREHDAGSPAPETRPQPLEIPRSTNWARISEEPDAG